MLNIPAIHLVYYRHHRNDVSLADDLAKNKKRENEREASSAFGLGVGFAHRRAFQSFPRSADSEARAFLPVLRAFTCVLLGVLLLRIIFDR